MSALVQELCLNVVVVEDHDSLRGLIVQALTEAGHAARGLASAEELQDLGDQGSVDLFLIDLNLPGEDGLGLSKRLRAAFPLVGIIMVTARAELKDRIAGYDHGADLYLRKPFEVEEMIAAVAALGRRRGSERALDHVQAGQYVLVQSSLTLKRNPDISIALTAGEAQVLVALARAPAQRLDSWQLIEALGIPNDANARGNLEVRLTRLRKKLITQAGAPANCLESIRRSGYQLCIALQVL